MKNEQSSSQARSAEPRQADDLDVTAALTENAQEILDQLPLRRVQLEQPLDDGGARIRVSVEPGQAHELPESVVVELANGPVVIPLDAAESYRLVVPSEPVTLPAKSD